MPAQKDAAMPRRHAFTRHPITAVQMQANMRRACVLGLTLPESKRARQNEARGASAKLEARGLQFARKVYGSFRQPQCTLKDPPLTSTDSGSRAACSHARSACTHGTRNELHHSLQLLGLA
eukprot:6204408-Pleurochrysis_carterae.AAC.3